jgi:hypothetical protein
VLPAICTEEVITLGAELEDGTVIRGQNNISHPDVAAGPECAGAVPHKHLQWVTRVVHACAALHAWAGCLCLLSC